VSATEIGVGGSPPVPPPLESEAAVTSGWADGSPVVSVLCQTYQHAPYIEMALRGLLAQRTSFRFEILVRDDASTDGTADIVADFRARYPSIVQAVLERENRYPEVHALPILRKLARAPYIALCDGDDYWTDPSKLSQQVRLLEGRPDLVLSHHDAIVVRDGAVVQASYLPRRFQRDLSGQELRQGAWVLTQTLLHRNVDIEFPRSAERIVTGDELNRAVLGRHGGAGYQPSISPSVYRQHAGGVWSPLDRRMRAAEASKSLFWIGMHFADQAEHEDAAVFVRRAARALLATIGEEDRIDVGAPPSPKRRGPRIRPPNFRLAQAWVRRLRSFRR